MKSMEKSHYHYFKRVLFTERSKAQRMLSYLMLIDVLLFSIIGWIYILK